MTYIMQFKCTSSVSCGAVIFISIYKHIHLFSLCVSNIFILHFDLPLYL